jgi:hypothetical protein
VAVDLTKSNDKYHCEYWHKDGQTEDRCYKKKSLRPKDRQVMAAIKHMRSLQNEPKVEVKYMHCDNSEENHDIYNYIKAKCPGIRCKFEFTAPNSPQLIGKLKRKFATLYGTVRAILNGSKLTPLLRNVMWAFCFFHAARLDIILILPDTKLSPYEMYHEEPPLEYHF